MKIKSAVLFLTALVVIPDLILAQSREELARKADQAYTTGDFETCSQLYDQVIAMGAKSENAFYNAACCNALNGNKDRAFECFELAIKAGFKDVGHCSSDPDLRSLRDDPRWSGLLEKVTAAEQEYMAGINPELYKMYEQDQSDRMSGEIDWDIVAKHDEEHRIRVLEIFEAGNMETADDYYHAAMIMQHGRDSSDYLLANEFSSKAAELNPDHPVAKWLSAASWDRYLLSVGKPQWYGTQYMQNDSDGLWTIEPIDTTAVTDDDRKALGVPTLAETYKRLESMNR